MNDVTVLISSAGRRGALVEAFRGAFKHLDITGRMIDMALLSSAGHLADQLDRGPCVHGSGLHPKDDRDLFGAVSLAPRPHH